MTGVTEKVLAKASGRYSPGRLLVISQVYVPDPAAVGQHIADAAEEMVRRGWSVSVLTSARGYEDPTNRFPGREDRAGVRVRRFPLSSFGKRSILVRLVAQSLFLAQALIWSLFGPRPDVILVSTSPPFAGFVGAIISRLRRAPFVWWVMDINPDQMVVAGKVQQTSILARLFDWMNRVTLHRAATVVALDEFMARRLSAKLPVGDRLVVIPPWSHTSPAESPLPIENAFRRRHGLEGRFIVMYAGNHALQHPLETLLEAAQAMEHDPRIGFMFVGGGAGKQEVDRRIASGATNLWSLPYQPLDDLQETLAAANVHVVSMGTEMVGIVHPCKIYGVMAVGRPILFFGPVESHAGQLVVPHQLGWHVNHGDVSAAISAISEAMTVSPAELASLEHRAVDLTSGERSPGELRTRFCDALVAASTTRRT